MENNDEKSEVYQTGEFCLSLHTCITVVFTEYQRAVDTCWLAFYGFQSFPRRTPCSESESHLITRGHLAIKFAPQHRRFEMYYLGRTKSALIACLAFGVLLITLMAIENRLSNSGWGLSSDQENLVGNIQKSIFTFIISLA